MLEKNKFKIPHVSSAQKKLPMKAKEVQGCRYYVSLTGFKGA